MAKCFDVVGYVEPCNAVRQKYTGRALLMTGSADTSVAQNVFTFSENGIKVTNFYGSDFENIVSDWNSNGGKAVPITIYVDNPFGVTVQGNTDSGRVSYTKTIPVSIPATRDGKAEEFIMGIQKGFNNVAFVVLETFGNANENDIFGAYSPVRLDPASVTRSEYENGGAWTFNLICEEPVLNVISTIPNLGNALDSLNA